MEAKNYNLKDDKSPYDIEYKCEFCGKLLSSKRNLYNHINTTHEGQKYFKCEFCGKSFTQQGNLNRHIPRHIKDDNEVQAFFFIRDGL